MVKEPYNSFYPNEDGESLTEEDLKARAMENLSKKANELMGCKPTLFNVQIQSQLEPVRFIVLDNGMLFCPDVFKRIEVMCNGA